MTDARGGRAAHPADTARRPIKLGAAGLAAVLAGACQTGGGPPGTATEPGTAPTFPAAEYRDLAEQGFVYVLDPAASSVRIFVYRGGPMARFGHNHVAAVTGFRGAVHLPDDPARGRFDLVFPVEDLALDRPADRDGVAGAFDSSPDSEAVAGTRANMLGPEVLDAQAHPRIGLHSVNVEGAPPVLEATVRVALHGQRRTLTVPVWIERADEARLVAEGQFTLRQSDFGIEPFSAAGGALHVRDRLSIRFRLVGDRRTDPFPTE